jgi:uncharacterized membrane protein
MLAEYNKFWAALIGAVLIAIEQWTGWHIAGLSEEIITIVLAFLTAIGVFAVPNLVRLRRTIP